MHLADAFIQSDLQWFQIIHLLSVCVFPGNWTHNLCAANAMLYHWATGTLTDGKGSSWNQWRTFNFRTNTYCTVISLIVAAKFMMLIYNLTEYFNQSTMHWIDQKWLCYKLFLCLWYKGFLCQIKCSSDLSINQKSWKSYIFHKILSSNIDDNKYLCNKIS